MAEKLSFNVSNFYHQSFSLPLKLINFINKEADAEAKQKLDRSCKHFYKEAPFFIIDTLEITEEKQRMENVQYDGCMDFIDDVELQTFLNKTANIWLTKKINAKFSRDLDKWIFNKLVRCDAPEISLVGYKIPFEKMEILTKSVDCFDMSGSSIVDSNGSPVPLEDALALLPNAQKIRMDNCHITRETMKKLLDIQLKLKPVELYLQQVDGVFDVKLFLEFLKKHVGPDSHFHVDFNFEKKFWIFPRCTGWLQRYYKNNFDKLYHKELEAGEKLPKLKSAAFPIKKQTWSEYFSSFLVYFALIFQFVQSKFRLMKHAKKVTFTEEYMERQYFNLPYPHMCYIRGSADADTMKKLEQTCKFFHKRNPYLIVDDLHVEADQKIIVTRNNKKMVLKNGEEIDKLGKFLWIVNSFCSDGMIANSVKPIIVEAINIKIGSFSLTNQYFKTLAKSHLGLVKNWNSIQGFIKTADDKVISLLELLSHLPNAEVVRAKVRGFNSLNANEPILLHQRNNIKHLQLQFYRDSIQADQMFDFLKKSLAPKSIVKLDFSEMTAEDMDVAGFKAQMKRKMDTWKLQIKKPTLKIVS